MAKLSNEEIKSLGKRKGLTPVEPIIYTNLTTPIKWVCDKGHEIEESVKHVRGVSFRCSGCIGEVATYVSEPPVKSGERIIAFDQATKDFGISIYDDGSLVYFDTIHFDKNKELDRRFVEIANFIDKVCREWQPDLIVFEDIQLQATNATGFLTFRVLSELIGIIKYVVTYHNIHYVIVLNKVWQAEFGISGRDRAAQKANCVKKVKDLFKVDVDNDCADAVLIGKWAALNRYRKVPAKLF